MASTESDNQQSAWADIRRRLVRITTWLLTILVILGILAMSYSFVQSDLKTPERWDTGVSILTALVILLGAVWTVQKWYLTKKIELEIQILENVARSEARWIMLKKDREEEAEQIDEMLEKLNAAKEEIETGKARFSELLRLNRKYHYHANFSAEYGDEYDRWRDRGKFGPEPVESEHSSATPKS